MQEDRWVGTALASDIALSGLLELEQKKKQTAFCSQDNWNFITVMLMITLNE